MSTAITTIAIANMNELELGRYHSSTRSRVCHNTAIVSLTLANWLELAHARFNSQDVSKSFKRSKMSAMDGSGVVEHERLADGIGKANEPE